MWASFTDCIDGNLDMFNLHKKLFMLSGLLAVISLLQGCMSEDEAYAFDYVYRYDVHLDDSEAVAVDAYSQADVSLSTHALAPPLQSLLSRISCVQFIQIKQTLDEAAFFDLTEIPEFDCYVDSSVVIQDKLFLSGLFGHMKEKGLDEDDLGHFIFNEPTFSVLSPKDSIACYLIMYDLSVSGVQRPKCLLYSKHINRISKYQFKLKTDIEKQTLIMIANAIDDTNAKRYLMSWKKEDLLNLRQELKLDSSLIQTLTSTDAYLYRDNQVVYTNVQSELIPQELQENTVLFLATVQNQPEHHYTPFYTLDEVSYGQPFQRMLQHKNMLGVSHKANQVYLYDLDQKQSSLTAVPQQTQSAEAYQPVVRPDLLHIKYPLYRKYMYEGALFTYYLRMKQGAANNIYEDDGQTPILDEEDVQVRYQNVGFRLMKFGIDGQVHDIAPLPQQLDLRLTSQKLSFEDLHQHKLLYAPLPQNFRINQYMDVRLLERKTTEQHVLLMYIKWHKPYFDFIKLSEPENIFSLYAYDMHADHWIMQPNTQQPKDFLDATFFENVQCFQDDSEAQATKTDIDSEQKTQEQHEHAEKLLVAKLKRFHVKAKLKSILIQCYNPSGQSEEATLSLDQDEVSIEEQAEKAEKARPSHLFKIEYLSSQNTT